MRSAIFENRVFERITRKKFYFFWFFLILGVARLVAHGGKWGSLQEMGKPAWPSIRGIASRESGALHQNGGGIGKNAASGHLAPAS
jgi:hypothetical protein